MRKWLVFICLISAISDARRIYVDISATGANNGTSWTNAYADLQAAIQSAVAMDTLWVAAGAYKPASDTVRSVSFALSKELSLFGGFKGDETNPGQRNISNNPTVLSGDIGEPGDTSDNSYCVVDVSAAVLMDGFRISGGQAVYSGGGLAVEGVAATIRNCEFLDNYAYYEGCAIECGGGWDTTELHLENCVFTRNAGGAGGAITAGGWGKTRVFMKNCMVFGNRTNNGSAIQVGMHGSEVLIMENCVVHSNTILPPFTRNGGTIDFDGDPVDTLMMLNCTIAQNNALGTLAMGSSVCTLSNSIFWGTIHSDSLLPAISYSCINMTALDGVNGNTAQDPLFLNPEQDDFRLNPLSPCIDAADGAKAPAADIQGKGRFDNLIAANTGAGTPPYADMGAYEFTANLSGNAPFFTSASEVSISKGTPFVYKAAAVDVDGDPVILTFPGLPGWLSVSHDTVRGIVTPSTYDTLLTVIASDGTLSDTLIVIIHNLSVVVPKNGEWTIYDTSNGLRSNSITAIEIDHMGDKWIGTNNGLHRLNGQAWTIFTDSNSSVPGNDISALYEDRSSRLWVGTGYNGLATLTGTMWQACTMSTGGYTAGPTVNAVIQDNAGTVWVGTDNGLASYNGSTWMVDFPSDYTASGCFTLAVPGIAVAPNSDLWITVQTTNCGNPVNPFYTNGLRRLSSGAWTSHMTTSMPWNAYEKLKAVACDRQGVVWAGTLGKGLVKYDGTDGEQFGRLEGLIDTNINTIAVDSLNNKWIGTKNGLCMRDSASWTNYLVRDGLPGLTVTAIAVQRDTLWIGTNNGLAKFVYRPGIAIESRRVSVRGSASLTVCPNPFNPATAIRYETGPAGKGVVSILNLNGQMVFSQKVRGAGGLTWHAADRASGIYLCRLTAGKRVLSKTMILVK